MERILVGVDGTEESLRAVEWAAELAACAGAAVVLVSVLEAQTPRQLSDVVGEVEESVLHEWHLLVEQRMRGEWSVALRRLGVEFLTIVAAGDAAPTLLQLADAERAELIVVGCRRRSRYREMLLGGVSNHLVHHSWIPVVVVPPPRPVWNRLESPIEAFDERRVPRDGGGVRVLP